MNIELSGRDDFQNRSLLPQTLTQLIPATSAQAMARGDSVIGCCLPVMYNKDF